MINFIKKNRKMLIILIVSIVLIIGVFSIVKYFTNENTLTISEKKWIDENTESSINVNVINNAGVFGYEGYGVYFDFLTNFSSDYDLKVNAVTFKNDSSLNGVTLGITRSLDKNDYVFYEDNYVVVTKNAGKYSNYSDLLDKKIGVLSNDEALIKKSLNINVTSYSSDEDLFKAFGSDVEYIILPRLLYANYIMSNNLNVCMQLSDLNYYYTLSVDDSTLGSIMKKYFNTTWKKNSDLVYKENELDMYVNNLGITEIALDEINRRTYVYGFVENSPYEVMSSGNFGGISAVLLDEFSSMLNIELEYNKYKNLSLLKEATKKKEIDIYMSRYNTDDKYIDTTSGFDTKFSVILPRDDYSVVKSIDGLNEKVVYVEKDTKIYDYLKTVANFKIKTYTTEKELKKLNKEDVVIVVDSNSFEYYQNNILNNYTSRYEFYTNFDITYKVSNNNTFYKLLDNYMNFEDTDKIINAGIKNHYDTISIGKLIASVLKYILLFVVVALIGIVLYIKKSKHIKIAKKIKKEDKLKYIDQLTSLKNRNYLNDTKESWNNNTIYPQTIILIDLNHIKKINDLYGYDEGDKQIKTFANILIKMQLDNSEIMRTDGNEFVVYLVGYSKKQVVNYIHKLNKETEKMPYDKGAKFGYSMIEDNLKTVDDALNDALNDMDANENK